MDPLYALSEATPFKFAMVLVGWGMSEYLMCVSGRELSVPTAMFYNCVGLCFANLLWLDLSHLESFGEANGGGAELMAASTGVFYALGDYCFFMLAKGGGKGGGGESGVAAPDKSPPFTNVSVLAPICGLYVAVPVALGIIIQHEALTIRKVCGVLLALVAIFLLSEEDEEDEDAEEETHADVEAANVLQVGGVTQ
jgi:drug/metabolite transporter (DMT)-like permease